MKRNRNLLGCVGGGGVETLVALIDEVMLKRGHCFAFFLNYSPTEVSTSVADVASEVRVDRLKDRRCIYIQTVDSFFSNLKVFCVKNGKIYFL
jgi:hypothetical protein